MSICFFRPNEIAEIRLKFYNVNKTKNQSSLKLAPKQANAIETYEVYETDNEKLSPKLLIYESIDRLKRQFPKDISVKLTKLLRELKIVGASTYSIRHSATIELAKQVSSTKANVIARQLTSNPDQDNDRFNYVSQQRGEIWREGRNQLLSLSPLETEQLFVIPVSPYLTSGPPKICIPTRGEIEIRREFLRELKDRTNGMMLKAGLCAWNDDDEIRTLLSQSLISLIYLINDKEMLSARCIEEYEEQIDE
ncbi:MAG: hypothetical protein EZS28_022306 [Streblomastix strix]|uniref:Uncharacterized protein n=1 Tax=Streblomastix strix TaxID=222440 RepID=A0A5J4VHQ4_9EUKA|nr:MAG: hypothetical protein EZS28_022306 [Streblomastix strix]